MSRPLRAAWALPGLSSSGTAAAWPGLALAALGLLALWGLRLLTAQASGAGLHVDEAQYWDWSRQLQWGYYSKPPGIAALVAASTALWGDGVQGVRALAMACWVLSGGVLAWLAGRMVAPAAPVPGPGAAAWTLVLLLGTPAAGLLGLVATTDAPLLLCWSLALALSWQAWLASAQGGAATWAAWAGWLATGLVAGLGLLCKYTAAALWLSWAWLLWADAGRAWRARQCPTATASTASAAWLGLDAAWWRRCAGLALAGVVALACLAPHLAWNARWGWPTLRHTGEITTGAARYGGQGLWASVGDYLGGQLLLVGPVLVVVLVAGLWPTRGRGAGAAGNAKPPQMPTPAERWALAFAWPLPLLGLAQALWAHAQLNWTVPALAGLCLWAGLRAARAGWRWPAWLWCGGLGLGLGLAVALGPNLQAALARPAIDLATAVPGRADIWSRMRGWQAALDGLRPVLAAHAGVPVVADDRTVLAQAAHAWRDLPLRVQAWPHSGPARSHYALQQALQAGPAGWPPRLLWLGPQAPGAAQQQAYAAWQLVGQQQVGRVRLGLWLGQAVPGPMSSDQERAR